MTSRRSCADSGASTAQYDIVRATFTDGTNVPRIPPQRLGGGVYYRDGNWFVRVGLLHAFAAERHLGLRDPDRAATIC